MIEDLIKSVQANAPDFAHAANLDMLDPVPHRWMINPKCGIATSSDDYVFEGNHYITLYAPKSQLYALWFDPSPELVAHLRQTGILHNKHPDSMVGLLGVYSADTKSYMAMDTGILVPKKFVRERTRITLFSTAKGTLSSNRVNNATRLARTALQLRMICCEATKLGVPATQMDSNTTSLGSATGMGSTALDLIARL